MPLLHLANELLCHISENLELERDINAFAQANRRLYDLLNDYLYRHNIQHSGSSALSWAALQGQEATARKSLENRADNQATSHSYWRPLCVAAEKGHEEIVKLLLDKDTNVNPQGGTYGHALHAASYRGHEAVVKLLLDRDAEHNGWNNAGGGFYLNALYAAAACGHKAVVKILLDNDANVNARNLYYAAIQRAEYEGDAAVKEMLDEVARECGYAGGVEMLQN